MASRLEEQPKIDEDERNVVAVVKGRERYVVIYTDKYRSDALRNLGLWASNPELSFTWCDAALASKRMRELNNRVDKE